MKVLNTENFCRFFIMELGAILGAQWAGLGERRFSAGVWDPEGRRLP